MRLTLRHYSLVSLQKQPDDKRGLLEFHFANEICINNTAEVIKHPGIDEKVFGKNIEFAKSIGMVALSLQKEQLGYILNSLFVPLLDAAQMLLVNEVAITETIDKTWMDKVRVIYNLDLIFLKCKTLD